MVPLRSREHTVVIEKIWQREQNGFHARLWSIELPLEVERQLSRISRHEPPVVLAVKDNKSRMERTPDPPRAAVDDEIEMPAPDLRRDVGPIDRHIVKPKAMKPATVELCRRRLQQRRPIQPVLAGVVGVIASSPPSGTTNGDDDFAPVYVKPADRLDEALEALRSEAMLGGRIEIAARGRP